MPPFVLTASTASTVSIESDLPFQFYITSKIGQQRPNKTAGLTCFGVQVGFDGDFNSETVDDSPPAKFLSAVIEMEWNEMKEKPTKME
jgi:hypothetical protein